MTVAIFRWPPVRAFSIDDSATTEIDDAFSVQPLGERVRIGIHIAAPAVALARGHAVDTIAKSRMSTVYAPGLKYTMLPDDWIESLSLNEGRELPGAVAVRGCRRRNTRSVIDRVTT